jgi:predicted TIM-barrel fold metal-dependent hydrolase
VKRANVRSAMMSSVTHRLAALLLVAFALCCSRPGCGGQAAPDSAARIPRFDAHAHVHPFDTARAMELYARNGIVGFANASGGFGPGLEAALAQARPFGGRVIVFANLNPRGLLREGWVEREIAALRRAKELGAKGLKIYKALGLGFVDPAGARVKVDDPRLDPIFEECGRLGLVVDIHSGDPKAFFEPPTPANERYEELLANPGWSFFGRGYPSWEEVFGELERRVARHPGTTFIGVHFGNAPEEPERVARLLRRYPNLYVDTAARIGEIGRYPAEKLRAIFVEHRERILFATDFSMFGPELMLGAPDGTRPGAAEADLFFAAHWRFFETRERGIAHPTPIQGRWTVDAIGLPEEVLHDLYHRNAERLFGLPPLDRASPAKARKAAN